MAALQNYILRGNKKDDILLAREEQMIKREAALEAKRDKILLDKEAELRSAQAENEKLRLQIEQAHKTDKEESDTGVLPL